MLHFFVHQIRMSYIRILEKICVEVNEKVELQTLRGEISFNKIKIVYFRVDESEGYNAV